MWRSFSVCLSVCLSICLSLSLSLLLLLPTQHSCTLSFSPYASIFVCILYFHSPSHFFPLSLCSFRLAWTWTRMFKDKRTDERDAPKDKVVKSGVGLGRTRRMSKKKNKKEKIRRRKPSVKCSMSTHRFGYIGVVRPSDELHWKPDWQQERSCSWRQKRQYWQWRDWRWQSQQRWRWR